MELVGTNRFDHPKDTNLPGPRSRSIKHIFDRTSPLSRERQANVNVAREERSPCRLWCHTMLYPSRNVQIRHSHETFGCHQDAICFWGLQLPRSEPSDPLPSSFVHVDREDGEVHRDRLCMRPAGPRRQWHSSVPTVASMQGSASALTLNSLAYLRPMAH